jgi:hypothetical protein
MAASKPARHHAVDGAASPTGWDHAQGPSPPEGAETGRDLGPRHPVGGPGSHPNNPAGDPRRRRTGVGKSGEPVRTSYSDYPRLALLTRAAAGEARPIGNAARTR